MPREPTDGAVIEDSVVPPKRLVESPVFVLSTLRSGSTLLRVLLDTHSRIHAPHELHLRGLQVLVPKAFVAPAMAALSLDQRELEHLLWDRVLHLQLLRSGKDTIVDKTPGNVFIWQRLAECWSEARFVFLLRHPAAVVDSLALAWPGRRRPRIEHQVLGYARAIETARAQLEGQVVRYEDLVSHPRETTKALCDFLGLAWEAEMLNYGRADHGPLVAGLGDWGDKIRSGRVQAARSLPEIPIESADLRDVVATWGY
jgi:Sulfotransferase family